MEIRQKSLIRAYRASWTIDASGGAISHSSTDRGSLVCRNGVIFLSLWLASLVRALPIWQKRCVRIPSLHLRKLVWHGPGVFPRPPIRPISEYLPIVALAPQGDWLPCLRCRRVVSRGSKDINLESLDIRIFSRIGGVANALFGRTYPSSLG